VRGDFDLASPTPVWKTKLSIPYAEQCVLIKSAEVQNAASPWTFACRFSPNDSNRRITYERIIERVQSALGLKYQPDATAANVNQVFFTESSKPDWKLVVTKG
jgi:hypothetical protein